MGKLVFNHENCTGCRACELACSFRKEGVFSPSKSRIKVVRVDERGIDIPMGCEHCDDAPCIAVCAVKALKRDPETDAVLLDREICIGCKQCMVICPFTAILYDTEDKRFYKCDLCDGDPECVKWCLTGGVEYHECLEEFPKRKTGQRVKRFLRNVQDTAGGPPVEGKK
jgi:Fe-S-cluster-containing hydrogenase component 2